jgi:protein-S-isoprenylcysteine O-methyltransferase Ste14
MFRQLELKVPPPAVGLIVAAAMWQLARMFPLVDAPFLARISLAVVMAVLGLCLDLSALNLFFRKRTAINPMKPQNTSVMVVSGIYHFTRNPMYLGMACILIAWALYLDSVFALAGSVLFVLYINQFQIKPEERFLLNKFGTAYADYLKRVRRWV